MFVCFWCTDETENPRKPEQGQRKGTAPPLHRTLWHSSCLPISIQQTTRASSYQDGTDGLTVVSMAGLGLFPPYSCWFPESNRSDLFFCWTRICFASFFHWISFNLSFSVSSPRGVHSSWTCWPLSHALSSILISLAPPVSQSDRRDVPLSFSPLSSLFVSPLEPRAFSLHLKNISLHLCKNTQHFG